MVHYCVTNMPGAVPKTSTLALTNATLPYIRHLARAGLSSAVTDMPGLISGINVHAGRIVSAPVAAALGYPATPVESAIAA